MGDISCCSGMLQAQWRQAAVDDVRSASATEDRGPNSKDHVDASILQNLLSYWNLR